MKKVTLLRPESVPLPDVPVAEVERPLDAGAADAFHETRDDFVGTGSGLFVGDAHLELFVRLGLRSGRPAFRVAGGPGGATRFWLRPWRGLAGLRFVRADRLDRTGGGLRRRLMLRLGHLSVFCRGGTQDSIFGGL